MVMILDYSQIAIAAVMSDAHSGDSTRIDEEMSRHIILNSIRLHRSRHAREHKEMIIACDGPGSWRKDRFPQYKAHRKKLRDDSSVDWDMLHRVLHEVRRDLRDHFPYRVVHVPMTEADDVIGVVARHAHAYGIPCLIVSGDKDFHQLHRTVPGDDLLGGMGEKRTVTQWSPTPSVRGYVHCDDPVESLGLHVAAGDSGDGVPNILSDDKVFVDERKQRVVSAKMKAEWLRFWTEDGIDDGFWAEYQRGGVWKSVGHPDKKSTHAPVCVHEIRENYKRNVAMIDLRSTPPDIRSSVLHALAEPAKGDFNTVMRYMADNGMTLLMDHAQDFV